MCAWLKPGVNEKFIANCATTVWCDNKLNAVNFDYQLVERDSLPVDMSPTSNRKPASSRQTGDPESRGDAADDTFSSTEAEPGAVGHDALDNAAIHR